MSKPSGWLPTKPSPNQLFMLKMFSKGWRYRLFNKRPGSWNTYWSLRRRNLVSGLSDCNELTQKGRDVLAYYSERQSKDSTC